MYFSGWWSWPQPKMNKNPKIAKKIVLEKHHFLSQEKGAKKLKNKLRLLFNTWCFDLYHLSFYFLFLNLCNLQKFRSYRVGWGGPQNSNAQGPTNHLWRPWSKRKVTAVQRNQLLLWKQLLKLFSFISSDILFPFLTTFCVFLLFFHLSCLILFFIFQ